MSAAVFIIIALSLVLQPILAEARGRFGPQRTPEEAVQVLTERLDLTDEQKQEYLEFIQEQRQRGPGGKFRGGKMGGGFSKTPEQVIAHLTASLNLTEEQATLIEPIIQQSLEKRHDVFDKYRDQKLKVRGAMRTEMQAIGGETHAQLSTVLTDEQMEELNTIQEERQDRIGKRQNHRGPRGF